MSEEAKPKRLNPFFDPLKIPDDHVGDEFEIRIPNARIVHLVEATREPPSPLDDRRAFHLMGYSESLWPHGIFKLTITDTEVLGTSFSATARGDQRKITVVLDHFEFEQMYQLALSRETVDATLGVTWNNEGEIDGFYAFSLCSSLSDWMTFCT